MLRSWNSSNTTSPNRSSAGSDCSIRVSTPSVTTWTLVVGPIARFVANAVSDGLPQALTQERRHATGRGPGREPSRLEHDDSAALEPWFAQKRERHTGGLAGAWRRLKHRPSAAAERIPQCGQDLLDREPRTVTHDPRIARNLILAGRVRVESGTVCAKGSSDRWKWTQKGR